MNDYICEIKASPMSKFINPMTDFGFKYIFGREES